VNRRSSQAEICTNASAANHGFAPDSRSSLLGSGRFARSPSLHFSLALNVLFPSVAGHVLPLRRTNGFPTPLLVERVSSLSPPGKRVSPLDMWQTHFIVFLSVMRRRVRWGPYLPRYFRYFRPIFGLIFPLCACVRARACECV